MSVAKRSPLLGLMFAAALIGGGPGTVFAPVSPPTPPGSSKEELERIEAAKAKRARKLAKYTDTPQARANRAAFEIKHASAEPIPTPPNTDDFQP